MGHSVNYLGAWDPDTVYWGKIGPSGGHNPGGPDEVEYQGALWIANYYNTDWNPITDLPGKSGAWTLAPGSHPIYNPVAPEAPTGLTAGHTSDTSISLFWNAAEIHGIGSVSSYDVYDNNIKIGTTTTTTFTANNLTAGSSNHFQVIANDVTGASGSDSLTVSTHSGETDTGKYFSPYVDMTLPTTNIVKLSEASGLRDMTLAFMQNSTADMTGNTLTSGAAPEVSFGGLGSHTTLSTGAIIDQVHQVESEGGNVTISFGGASGRDPASIAEQYQAQLHANGESNAAAHAAAVSMLQSEYQSVIDTYGVSHLDFDVEDDSPDYGVTTFKVVDDTVANGLRAEAIAKLEAANPNLKISYTLAARPSEGLSKTTEANGGSGDSYDVITQALADGVRIDVVNLMTMDFYDGTKGNKMGQAAIDAANHAHTELAAISPDTLIGITPMIGQNDDYGATGASYDDGVDEVFSLADAQMVENFAAANSWVGGIGEWELPRDSAETKKHVHVAPGQTMSGVVQSAFQFAHIFDQVTTTTGGGAGVIRGDAQGDVLLGTASHDVLKGGGGADLLMGGAGSDVIKGGAGADQLSGGGGHDRFVFSKVSDSTLDAADKITGLTNHDRIVLSHIDADATVAGDQAFHLAGDHFTGHAGELIVSYDAATHLTWIEGDTNGDGKADFALSVKGDHHDFHHFVL